MKTTLATLFLLACAVPALCGDYRTRQTYQSPSYYQQSFNHDYQQHNNYRRRVRVDIVNDVLQINPAYSSAYAPDAYDGATQAELLTQIKALQLQIQALSLVSKPQPVVTPPVVVIPTAPDGKAAPPPYILPTPPVGTAPAPPVVVPPAKIGNGPKPGLGVLMTKCAACHQAGHLSPGQQFTMLDEKGQLTKEALASPARLLMLSKTYQGSMPPPNNIYGIAAVTDQEYGSLVDLLGGK